MKVLLSLALLMLSACSNKPPVNPVNVTPDGKPITTYSVSVENVTVEGTDAKEVSVEKAKVELAILLSQ